MPAVRLSERINTLFQRAKWVEARTILERERERSPRSHWVLTQLGVTFYEEERYEDALAIFLESLKFKDDCPLTLWNLAGALDALGKHAEALRVYIWILRSRKTPKEDPCWESREWTDSLKTDCVYRSGVCFRHMGKKREAVHLFHQYADLLVTGFEGSYSVADVRAEIRKLRGANKGSPEGRELKKIVSSTLQLPGIEQMAGRQNTLPRFSERELLPSRRVASTK